MRHFLLSIAIAAVLVSCGSEGHNEHEGHEGDEGHAQTMATSVKLNNGAQWEANAETTQGIQNMSKLMAGLPDSAGVADYNNLKLKLDAEFESILKKCTMKGEAHDQLHQYLMPLKTSIDKMASTSLDSTRDASKDVKKQLSEYGTYFK